MFDITASQNRKMNKLKDWRNRYSKEEYPYKVILNMFYELFSIELIWDDINSAFSGRKQYNDTNQAYNHMGELKRNVQLSVIHQNLESYLKNDRIACGVKYSDYKEMVNKAQNGDNHKVIEIEYSYWFYCQYWEVVLEWAAYGYLGYDKHSAYQAVTGGDLNLGDLKLNTFQETVQSLSVILGTSFSWKDADGNSINPVLSEEKKYYPDSFVLLPSLWNKTPSPTKESGPIVTTTSIKDTFNDIVEILSPYKNDILKIYVKGIDIRNRTMRVNNSGILTIDKGSPFSGKNIHIHHYIDRDHLYLGIRDGKIQVCLKCEITFHESEGEVKSIRIYEFPRDSNNQILKYEDGKIYHFKNRKRGI